MEYKEIDSAGIAVDRFSRHCLGFSVKTQGLKYFTSFFADELDLLAADSSFDYEQLEIFDHVCYERICKLYFCITNRTNTLLAIGQNSSFGSLDFESLMLLITKVLVLDFLNGSISITEAACNWRCFNCQLVGMSLDIFQIYQSCLFHEAQTNVYVICHILDCTFI